MRVRDRRWLVGPRTGAFRRHSSKYPSAFARSRRGAFSSRANEFHIRTGRCVIQEKGVCAQRPYEGVKNMRLTSKMMALNSIRSLIIGAGLAVCAFAVSAAAQTACPAGQTSEGGDPDFSCSWDLPGGGQATRNCTAGNACQNGAVLSCCPVMSGHVVVSVMCICTDLGGPFPPACAPNSVYPCE